MRLIEHHTFDMERALYGEEQLYLKNCTSDGPMDGESAQRNAMMLKFKVAFSTFDIHFGIIITLKSEIPS